MADSENNTNTTETESSGASSSTMTNASPVTTISLEGRKQILSDADEITESNIIDVLSKALTVHDHNAFEEKYLYEYYLGKQPIRFKTKKYRQDVNNRIAENRAQEIVTFKSSYALGEPVQYVLRSGITDGLDALNQINDWMFSRKKSAEDKRLANWMHICGLGVRMVVPEKNDYAKAPFHIYTLDPRTSFVIYRNDLGKTPLLGVTYITKDDGATRTYYCYTDSEYFEIEGNMPVGVITRHEPTLLGRIPIIEYPLNMGREGVFEPVISLLDALNILSSNRVDSVQSFVDAIMLFHNVQITNDVITQMREMGALMYSDTDASSPGEIKYLVSELNQTQTQTLKDDLWQSIKEIVGMPSQSDGSASSSSNNGAEIVRNGWEQAESCAKDFELEFDGSETDMLALCLRIADTMAPRYYTDTVDAGVIRSLGMLKIGDIRIQFTRRNYENIATKSAVLLQMLGSDKVHPKLAFEHSGMFADPERAYTESMEYYKSVTDNDGGVNGSDDGARDPNASA